MQLGAKIVLPTDADACMICTYNVGPTFQIDIEPTYWCFLLSCHQQGHSDLSQIIKDEEINVALMDKLGSC